MNIILNFNNNINISFDRYIDAFIVNEVEDLLTKGTIDEEEYKYMRKPILSKHID